MTRLAWLIALILATSSQTWAHKPFFSDGNSIRDNAFAVADIEISIVVYHEVTCAEQALWLSFDAEPGELLFYQLGVPMLERLETYRPAIAVIAPGLPEIDLPFAVPEGMGGRLLTTSTISNPEEFFEPFTNTSSWILTEELMALPQGGPGYVVAWHPEGLTGKLWVAVGTVEDFGHNDFERLAGINDTLQDFHETRFWSPRPETTQCDNPLGLDVGGCQSTPASAWWALLTTLLLYRRFSSTQRDSTTG